MNISAGKRRDAILDLLIEHQEMSARDLAMAIGVSEATVRRDLKNLAASGEVVLVYGGAKLRHAPDFSFRSKSTRHTISKTVIARLAAEQISDQEQVFLDSGTTCFAMASYLKRKRGLSIIVNSARLALELEGVEASIILLGGQYRTDRMDTVGPLAVSALNQLRGYVCFIGADGLSLDFGPAAVDIDSASLYRLAVQHARRTVLLVDHSKFHAASLCKIVDWEAISQVITDSPPPAPWAAFFQARGIDVLYPEDDSSSDFPSQETRHAEATGHSSLGCPEAEPDHLPADSGQPVLPRAEGGAGPLLEEGPAADPAGHGNHSRLREHAE